MSEGSPGPMTCARCKQALPREVTYCASCGFDNGEVARMGKWAAMDEKIEEHLNWLWFKQFLGRFFFWMR